MPRVTIPLGKVNLDKGQAPGDHLWMASGCTLTESGYEIQPSRSAYISGVGPGQNPLGAHVWPGPGDERIYAAFNSTIYEVPAYTTGSFNDVSGSSYSNTTNGVTFASYGEYCFASNGVNKIQQIRVPSTIGGTENFGDMNYTDTSAVIAPKYICSHKNHLIGVHATMLANYGLIGEHTTAVGGAFTNQPTGDSVTVTSASGAADNGITSTIYGTRVGQGDTVSFEQVTLAGLGTAVTAINNWDRILAVKKGVSAGDFTWTETSGGLTITTALAAAINAGVSSVSPNLGAGDQLITIVADGATTRQVGITYTKYVAGTFYDSQALTGTTELQSNDRMLNVQEVLIGDVENTRTVTISTYNYAITSEHPFTAWISGTDDPEGFGLPAVSPTIVGCEVLPLFDGAGEATGVIDGGDCFFIFKEGSIYRVDGPPFVSTIIEYGKGMQAGSVPYRQGSRIYFWSEQGLCYIDINTNQVVNLFDGRMLRSTTDTGNANESMLTGTFPSPPASGTTLTINRILNTGYDDAVPVRISGDSKYGFVLCIFENSVTTTRCNLLYQSVEDCFVSLGAFDDPHEFPVECKRAAISSDTFPLSKLRIIYDAGATNSVDTFVIRGVNETSRSSAEKMFVAMPFVHTAPDEGRARVVAVRPILEELFTGGSFRPDASDLIILTKRYEGQGWDLCTPSRGSTFTKDGWIKVEDSPYGISNAIIIRPNSSGATSSSNSSPGSFYAVEVQYEIATNRSE